MLDSDPSFLSAVQVCRNEFNRARRMLEKIAPLAVLISRECPELFDQDSPRGKYNYDLFIKLLEERDYASLMAELERLKPFYHAKIQKRKAKRVNPHDL